LFLCAHSFTCSQPWTTTDLLSDTMSDLPFPEPHTVSVSSEIQSHGKYSFVSFSFLKCPCFCFCQYFLHFCCWIVFHYVPLSQSVYLFTCWSVLACFLLFTLTSKAAMNLHV
jgi:hypothetical protein